MFAITVQANDPTIRLRRISEVVGSGQGDIKKGLKIDFVGEEGVDAGGLRKEWFLLLIREVFDEAHGKYTGFIQSLHAKSLVRTFRI